MIVCFGWATYKKQGSDWNRVSTLQRWEQRHSGFCLWSYSVIGISSAHLSNHQVLHSTARYIIKLKERKLRECWSQNANRGLLSPTSASQWRTVCALQAENVIVTLHCSYEVFWLLVTYRVALFHYKEQQHYLKLNVFGFLVFWYKNNIAWAERNKRTNQLSMLTVWVEMDIQYEHRDDINTGLLYPSICHPNTPVTLCVFTVNELHYFWHVCVLSWINLQNTATISRNPNCI